MQSLSFQNLNAWNFDSSTCRFLRSRLVSWYQNRYWLLCLFLFASAEGAPETTPLTSGLVPKPKYHSVIPQSYAEMMEFLAGRRRAMETANFNTYVRMIPDGEVVSE